MSFKMAGKQFAENIQLRGGDTIFAQSDPEKYNIIAGLLNLARGLEELQGEIRSLQVAISHRR